MLDPMSREGLLMRWRCQHPGGIEVSAAPSRSDETDPSHANALWLAVTAPMAASWIAWPRFGINLGIKVLSSTLLRN